MKSKIFYTQLFGVLLIILIALIAIPIYKNRIPKELTKEVQKRLYQNKIEWVAVRAEGRDITLSGIAPTIALHNQAVKIAEQTQGIRTIHDKISPTVITPYSMNINYKDKELTFKGYMPSKESMDELFKTVAERYPTYKIIQSVDIGTGEPREWEELVLIVSLLLKELDSGIVNIIDTKVTFYGKCQTTKQENEIIQYLDEFKHIGFTIQSRIVAMDEGGQVCQKKFNDLLSKNKIEFEAGKSIVKAQNETLLQSLVDISSLCPKAKIEIIGHTDSMGNEIKNQELSQSRAKAVVAKLFQLGIPLEQMKAIGKGEHEPITDNGTEAGRRKNRRIEFRVKGY
ncbi:OmpA family protein [Sulfurovum sp. bin170]|uniref:OmpA family protein n=1 Tax=Sulfurovum sp. bin170 TaxID=2695268 RepID=UPI0013DF44A3|nr:OmpA family protein [Sulfurovum sp. bin170]NEW59712.1 OmpA family protein [Sulfurovum sp. bin170]